MGYETTGVLAVKDLCLPSPAALKKGVAILECIQQIPCNPCVDACPFNAITMTDLNTPPAIDYEKCTGCSKCVGVCPGLAIFVVKNTGSSAWVTLPYEFLPLPQVGDTVTGLDREGKEKGTGTVMKIKKINKCALITIKVPKKLGMEIRNIRIP